jgi:hypothetical protein
MLIANPIYDTVFKFLLEDLTVARRLLSTIIGEEIIDLDVRPQEQTTPSNKFLLTVFRVDFKAVIRTSSGQQKKILIELQKGKQRFDIMRFRHYLGANYSHTDIVDGETVVLPIITIYFLGFKLDLVRPVLKVGRVYEDIRTGEILHEQDTFIEKLTHDCFVIQIPALPASTQNKVERILSVFNQRWVLDINNKWFLNYPAENDDDDLGLIINRLAMAAQSETVQNQIRAEEQIDEFIENKLRENEKQIAKREEIIAQKDAVIEEKDAVIEEKDAVIEEKDAVIEEKDAVIEEKDAVIEEKDAALEEKDTALEEKEQEIERQKRENADLLRRITELERR